MVKGSNMSGVDPTILLNANYGNISAILASGTSLWHNKGYDTTNIFAVDNSARTLPTGQQANFGGEERFRIRRRGGRVHKAWLRVNISAGTLNAANEAAYVDDLGQLFLENVRVEYASKTIQEYNGEAEKAYNRLVYNDISREHHNAMLLAGLPPGVGGSEASRSSTLTPPTLPAQILFIPLDWLWFTKYEDYSLTPEALSSELDVVIRYRALEQLVYARVIATGLTPAGDPFTTRPAITSVELFTQLVFEPHAMKNMYLRTFESEQGQLFKILDLERQVNQAIAAAAGTYTIRLDNLRLDSSFLMFFVRHVTKNTNWAIDRMQSDVTPTILSGAGSVAALTPITSFRLRANGSTIYDTCTDVENRAVWRSIYFPGSNVAEPIYFIPFSWLLREVKNVAGFQNLTNLGNLELELVMPVRAVDSELDVYSVCHNAIQQKRGDIIRALR